MNSEYITVVCIDKVYDEGRYINLYKIGEKYKAEYCYDRCLISGNDYIEYEWKVYCAEYNHYQFTHKDFELYFEDLSKRRSRKIDEVLE
jgi:hypothetical protein